MKKLCLILLTILIWMPSAIAQGATSDLLELLAVVPNTPAVRESIVSYIDYHALETTREGVGQFESVADFMSAREDESSAIWIAASMGISSGPDIYQFLISGGEEWQTVVGFDFFDIDRAITFGEIPSNGMILVGDFDTDAIGTAFSARDFTSEPTGDFTLWCGPIGCDEGQTMHLADRNVANPFGGPLGRQEPVLVSDNMLINSADSDVIGATLDTILDEITSLSENPTYATALSAINPDNVLIQAQFLHPSFFLADVATFMLNPEASQPQLDILDEAIIPHYELVLMVDTVSLDDGEQVAYVVMVYDDADNANTAIEVATSRLETMQSLATPMMFQELLDSREVSEISSYVLADDATDKQLAVLEFHAPLPTNEEGDFGFTPSSMVFRLLINMVYQRDTHWMMPGSIER